MKGIINLQDTLTGIRRVEAIATTQKLALCLEEHEVREMINTLLGMLDVHSGLKKKTEKIINFNFPWEKTPREIKADTQHEVVAKKFKASFYEALLTTKGYSQIEVWEEVLSIQELITINQLWNPYGIYIAFRCNSVTATSYNLTICTKEKYHLLPKSVKKSA